MADTLLLHFTAVTAGSPVSWSQLTEEGQQTAAGQTADLSELAEQAAHCRVLVWLAAEAVSIVTIDVPAQQQRQLSRILPALLEEQVAEDIDALHFVVVGSVVDGIANVAIVAREIMDDCLTRCSYEYKR